MLIINNLCKIPFHDFQSRSNQTWSYRIAKKLRVYNFDKLARKSFCMSALSTSSKGKLYNPLADIAESARERNKISWRELP